MRPRAFHRSEPASAAVNATPLIDVVLCMIVFFLLVGRLAETQRTPMDLPESAAGLAERHAESFVINLLREPDGGVSVVVNEDPVTLDRVGPMLEEKRRAYPGVVVTIRAPRDLPYGMLEPALRAAAAAGVSDVRLATRPAAEGPR